MLALQSSIWRDFFSAMAESLKNLKYTNAFSSFLMCYTQNRSALVRELLSKNSLFVGQFRTRDLISFITDLHQTVNYYSTIHC